MELTPGQMRELLREAGAEEVEDAAAEEMAQVLENYIGYITEEAVALADADGRRTVDKADVVRAEE